MPELPEVEFCARRLRRWIQGQRIAKVDVDPGRPLRSPDAAAFKAGLVGRTVFGVRRIGKQLFMDLDDAVLFVHLGMTGKFIERKSGKRARKGTRMTLTFEGGARVDYVDPRRFGHLHLVPAREASQHPIVQRLGPDALATCRVPGALAAAIGPTRRAIKVALMDQQRLAGVGNIYAAEALYLAGINPWRRANTLSAGEWAPLAAGIVESMTESLARERDDEIRYLQDRDAANPFLVYGRAGVPCGRCGTAIERKVQAQRATFWCPGCQPAPPPAE